MLGLNIFRGNKTVTCPYCMDVVSKAKLKYKCKKCETEYPSNIKVQSCTKKNCGGLLELNCPTCKNELPLTIFQYDKYIKFCIVGQTNCGKTNYITVMLNEFQKKLNKKMLISAVDSTTTEIYNEYYDLIYNQKIPPEGTKAGHLTPQLWQITNCMKFNKLKSEYPVYSMTIFDGAGEDWEKMRDEVRRYINGSDYIFFLVDPLKLPEIRKQLGLPSENDNTSKDMVKNMAEYLKNACGLSVKSKIDKPVALILTKFDEIIGLMESAQVTQENESAYSGTYMKSDADAVDAEIRSWLETIGESYFLSQLEIHFKKIRFFGVSSYGHAPTENGIGEIMPHRVLDPIIWVLSNENIIK